VFGTDLRNTWGRNKSPSYHFSDCILAADRSGNTSERAVPVISKKGNSSLRYALYQTALIASNKSSPIMRDYTRILQGRERERGIKTKMRIKLAFKLLVIAWTLMKKEERFNPDYLKWD